MTICMQGQACLFGDVVDGEMRLNDSGHAAKQCWNDIPVHFPHVELDEWEIMPNPIHDIEMMANGRVTACRAPTAGPQPRSLGALMAGFKSAVNPPHPRYTLVAGRFRMAPQ